MVEKIIRFILTIEEYKQVYQNIEKSVLAQYLIVAKQKIFRKEKTY